MLIKSADDRESDLDVLNALLRRCATAADRQRIEQGIPNTHASAEGARDAA
jgi:hypothetical protein